MNSDHEQLSKSLAELRQRLTDTHRHVMNLEVSVSKQTENTEEAIEKYSNLLVSLELHPTLPPPRQNLDLSLELNPAAAITQDLLSGPDIRKVIKPTLNAIAEDKRLERADLESERIKIENEFDQVIQESENLEQDIMEVEKKVHGINLQAEEIRIVSPLPLMTNRYLALTPICSRLLSMTDFQRLRTLKVLNVTLHRQKQRQLQTPLGLKLDCKLLNSGVIYIIVDCDFIA